MFKPLVSLSIALLFTSNTQAAPKKVVTPKVPKLVQLRAESVLSPQFFFQNSKEPLEIGSAFVARHPKTGAFVLCTAAHIFLAEVNGLAKDSDPKRVVKVIAESEKGAKVFGGGLVSLKKDKAGNGEDFVAFKVTKRPPFAFQFAKKSASEGETVWILGPKIYKGKTFGDSTDSLTVQLEDKNPYLTGYSGSPIINSRGEVVGIMLETVGDELGEMADGLSSLTMRSLFP